MLNFGTIKWLQICQNWAIEEPNVQVLQSRKLITYKITFANETKCANIAASSENKPYTGKTAAF
jgi:hypothetical protein